MYTHAHIIILYYIYIYIYNNNNNYVYIYIYIEPMKNGLHGCVGASARVAPLESATKTSICMFLVVQPVHLHQDACAARARKSANIHMGI